LRTSTYALTALTDDERPRWDRDFAELGRCLSIDPETITAQEPLAETTGD